MCRSYLFEAGETQRRPAVNEGDLQGEVACGLDVDGMPLLVEAEVVVGTCCGVNVLIGIRPWAHSEGGPGRTRREGRRGTQKLRAPRPVLHEEHFGGDVSAVASA